MLPGPGLALCLAPHLGHKDFSVGEFRDRAAARGPVEQGHLSTRKPTRGVVLQQPACAWFVLPWLVPTPAPEARPALGG